MRPMQCHRSGDAARDREAKTVAPPVGQPATCIATTVEKRRPLPIDSLVPEPIFTSTHAIDNDGVPSRTRIVPELQAVARGDILPAVPGAKDVFVVAAVDPPRDLVLTVPDGHGGNAVGWEHVLDPLPRLRMSPSSLTSMPAASGAGAPRRRCGPTWCSHLGAGDPSAPRAKRHLDPSQ